MGDHPLFARLNPQLRRWLAGRLGTQRVVAGDWVYRAGDEATAMYLVWSGRLELWRDTPTGAASLGMLGAGESLGAVKVLTGEEHETSARAVRDTELVAVDRGHLVGLTQESRQFSAALLASLGQALAATASLGASTRPKRSLLTVVPLDDRTSTAPLRDELAARLRTWGSTAVLTADAATAGGAGDEQFGRQLDDLERRHDRVLLEAGPATAAAPWTAFCLRQTDRVLAVAGRNPPPPALETVDGLPGCEIVFADRAITREARGRWLDVLQPRARHDLAAGATFRDGIAVLGRRVAGRSLGVVLSGGGARGLAHIGVLRGLLDAGLEIDRVGGTSMGAFIGSLFAAGSSPDEIVDQCRAELVDQNPFNDFTLPRVSMARGRKATGMMERLFEAACIEDLPRDFFCVTADLVTGDAVVHRRGDVLSLVGASMSIPGWAPPCRYGERVLVDGGVLNNFPVDVMAAVDEGPVIGVDAMGMTRGAAPSADEERRHLPNMMEILAGAATLGSRRRAETNAASAVLVISPSVGETGLLEFKHLDRLVDIGHRAATDAVATAEAGTLPIAS